MKTDLTRRQFLGQVGAGTALSVLGPSLLHANDPIQRPGKPRLLTSLAAYSFREYFVHATHERSTQVPKDKKITMLDFVDYCADQGCDGAELTGYYFPPDVGNDYLLKLKRHAFLRGVAISGTAVGNTFTHGPGAKRQEQMAYVKRWIDHASVMGAPHIRVFAGNQGNQTFASAMKNCIEGLEECGEYAAEKGVFLGIENHGGIVAEADALLEIIRTVNNPWIGINLDTGNFKTADIYGDIAKCAPYAINVQLKIEIRPRGQRQLVKADLARLIHILKGANYQGYVVLEHEVNEDPFETIPAYLAEMNALIAG